MRGFSSSSVVLLAVAAGLSGQARAEAFFTGIGDPDRESGALGVSGDGSVVVGWTQQEASLAPIAFAWTREGGLVELEPLGHGLVGSYFSQANAATWDGHVVVGVSSVDLRMVAEAVRWADGAGEVMGVPDPRPDDAVMPAWSEAIDVSGDGRVVVGFESFRWTEATGFQFLDMRILGLSRDGSTAVGYDPHGDPARWTAETGAVPLGSYHGVARAASSDGAVVVGGFTQNGRARPFRWTAQSGMVALDELAGAPFPGSANDVSDDGKIVVGELSSWSWPRAAIWDPLHGVRELQPYLEEKFGLDLSDWLLTEATAASADGRTIVGAALYDQAWVVTLPHRPGDVGRLDVRPGNPWNRIRPTSPEVVPVALFGSEALDARAVDEASLALGPAGASPVSGGSHHDVDGDGRDDLLVHFRADALGLEPGADEVCLEGRTLPGMPFRACDSVQVDPACGLGPGLAAPLTALALLLRRRA
jgi:hypothetical protein